MIYIVFLEHFLWIFLLSIFVTKFCTKKWRGIGASSKFGLEQVKQRGWNQLLPWKIWRKKALTQHKKVTMKINKKGSKFEIPRRKVVNFSFLKVVKLVKVITFFKVYIFQGVFNWKCCLRRVSAETWLWYLWILFFIKNFKLCRKHQEREDLLWKGKSFIWIYLHNNI